MSDTLQRFNLDTMSGVFPGTRTMVFQRVRLQPRDDPAALPEWGRLLWYEEPPACVLLLENKSENEEREGAADHPVRLEQPFQGELAGRLAAVLHAAGWALRACGSCAFWEPLVNPTLDGLPTGRCGWRAVPAQEAPLTPPDALLAQSLLALPCERWQPTGVLPAVAVSPTEPAAVPLADQTLTPIRKRAEQENDDRWTWSGQLRRMLQRLLKRSMSPPALQAPRTWEEKVVERSGVGAGTEPCFACQGRIANLGALAVATPDGDKQTFSVWRCRSCYTYYLNNWIDRWERLESLETEETYYRLAPEEALEVLAVIDNVVHAEHPARRHEREVQRAWMLALVAGRAPLSHQIRQGR